jgi:glyoxylase I family protein
MIEVLSVNHVSVLVSDTARALDFYHGVLGLKVDASRPELAFPGAWLHVGKQAIHLIEPETEMLHSQHLHGGRDRHLALDVADLDAAMAALDATGIDYALSRSGRRALFCRDPDGNAIELVEVSD